MPRRWLIGLVAAAVAAGAIGTGMAVMAPGDEAVAATVNPNLHVNQEPDFNNGGTVSVLTLRTAGLAVTAGADPGDSTLRLASVRQEKYPRSARAVDAPVQVWEWVPERAGNVIDNTRTGTDVVWGTLANRTTGKCLDLLGGDQADLAPVGQWDCNGTDNQRWASIPVGESRMIVSAVGFTPDQSSWRAMGFNGPNCVATEGAPLVARIGGAQSCTDLQAVPASYAFATNVVPSNEHDHADYRCLGGWRFLREGSKALIDLGPSQDGYVQVLGQKYDSTTDTIKEIDYNYNYDSWSVPKAQSMLYCNPS